jgi:uncharacterized membrane protein YvlD (DUF360 family)
MRLLAGLLVALVTNAIALLVASVVVSGFDIDAVAFPVVVIVFTCISVLARPVIEAFIEKSVQILASFVGLIAALVTLLLVDLLSDNLEIDGIGPLILASLIIWMGSIIADFLVGRWLFRKLTGRTA